MADEENTTIEIVDENGITIYCELFTIVEFEGNEYALLLPKEQAANEEAELVVMRIEGDDDDIAFINLDDDEFARVSEYIENMPDDDEE